MHALLARRVAVVSSSVIRTTRDFAWQLGDDTSRALFLPDVIRGPTIGLFAVLRSTSLSCLCWSLSVLSPISPCLLPGCWSSIRESVHCVKGYGGHNTQHMQSLEMGVCSVGPRMHVTLHAYCCIGCEAPEITVVLCRSRQIRTIHQSDSRGITSIMGSLQGPLGILCKAGSLECI